VVYTGFQAALRGGFFAIRLTIHSHEAELLDNAALSPIHVTSIEHSNHLSLWRIHKRKLTEHDPNILMIAGSPDSDTPATLRGVTE
jgi:hypothetical protein